MLNSLFASMATFFEGLQHIKSTAVPGPPRHTRYPGVCSTLEAFERGEQLTRQQRRYVARVRAKQLRRGIEIDG